MYLHMSLTVVYIVSLRNLRWFVLCRRLQQSLPFLFNVKSVIKNNMLLSIDMEVDSVYCILKRPNRVFPNEEMFYND